MIMNNSCVIAEGHIYCQKPRTATSTQLAPPFANLYLYFRYKQILTQLGVQYNCRFIQDGFLIMGNVTLAETLVAQLNEVINLRFTYVIHPSEAIYLGIVFFSRTAVCPNLRSGYSRSK
jgi:hypothetical protein